MDQTPEGWERLEATGPYLDYIGPIMQREESDGLALGIRVRGHHLNIAGTAHGGLLASLVDHALGRAVHAEAESGAVTVSLTTDYLAPAGEGDWVEARTQVERVGGKLAFAECALTVEGRPVVRARAVFAVLGDA